MDIVRLYSILVPFKVKVVPEIKSRFPPHLGGMLDSGGVFLGSSRANSMASTVLM